MTTLLAPPRWDTSAIYDGLDGRDFQAASEAVGAGVARLRALFDEHGIRAAGERPVTAAEVAAVEAVLADLEEQLVLQRRVGAYIYAKVSTDARDAQASTVRSRFQSATASLSPLLKRFDAWVAGLDLDELAARSPAAADHRFALAKAQAAAPHQMSEAEEDLASELGLTGGRAWAELHGQVTALLTAIVPGAADDGSAATLPMSAVRGLATNRDATLRRAAFEAEQGAWSSVAVPLASALNAFKGEANALNRRRGWHDSLDPALFTNNVDRRTLDAMQEAVVASLPDFARYNRAKARLLGGAEGAGLPWWDLIAPVGEGRSFTWAEATATVEQAFGTYSPKLAAFARRAVDGGWIDAEAREGKVGGAFCMPVEGDVSRVLLNFDGSFDSVQTLAHELGHGYHNTQLAGRTWIQRSTPMALAETASIFCETVMVQAGLSLADTDGQRLALLGTDLDGATQVVVDIHSRFLFERALSDERLRGTLSADRLSELMTEAQRATYLDGVDHDHLHPYLWAVKGHYFTAYYNWPYTFGLLFGLGLYAEFQRDPERFRSGYDDLLSRTGQGQASELAARFDIAVDSTRFWAASLDVLRARIDDYVELAARAVA